MMKDGMKKRFEEEGNEDMKAKAKAAYYKMDDKKKAMFDKLQKEKSGRRVEQDEGWKKKLAAMKETVGYY